MRLGYAGFITCRDVVRDEATGEVVELRCTYDRPTKRGDAPDGRKPKGASHWVPAAHALTAEVRLHDRLFAAERPDAVEEGRDFLESLSPGLLVALSREGQTPHRTTWDTWR
ncbi:hypothetical protein WMF39_47090 [Sorangium sp. So ce1504]|uniref:hypothetical protein n=1 Tax=unclassified Sorangium TaxID=2621164 RepID=UPI003F612B2F